MSSETEYKASQEEREPFWRFHKQNLNEDNDGNPKGSILRHGRCWLWVKSTVFGLSWSFPCRFCHAKIEWGGHGDYDLSLSLATPLFALWFHIENLIPWTVKKKWDRNHWFWTERSIGVSIHDQSIWIDIFKPEMSWSADQPKWMNIVIRPVDILLGKQQYKCEVLETMEVDVPMPEGTYHATVKKERATWSRKRSPFKIKRIDFDFDFKSGVPIPGNYDSDYCYDEDAIYSIGVTTDKLSNAIGTVVGRILETRKRYGGSFEWKPSVKSSK